eukprot:tig00000342_g24213.t1
MESDNQLAFEGLDPEEIQEEIDRRNEDEMRRQREAEARRAEISSWKETCAEEYGGFETYDRAAGEECFRGCHQCSSHKACKVSGKPERFKEGVCPERLDESILEVSEDSADEAAYDEFLLEGQLVESTAADERGVSIDMDDFSCEDYSADEIFDL